MPKRTFGNLRLQVRYVYSRLLRGQNKVRLCLPRRLAIAQRLVTYILLFAVSNNHLRAKEGQDGSSSGNIKQPCAARPAFQLEASELQLRGMRCTPNGHAHLRWRQHPCLDTDFIAAKSLVC